MRLVVIIPTINRRDVLARTVELLGRQTRLPDAVVISTTDRAFVSVAWHSAAAGQPPQPCGFPIFCLFGRPGISAQRNLALDVLLGQRQSAAIPPSVLPPLGAGDAITFFDDDFLPASNYFKVLEREFAANPGWAALHGSVPYNGAHHEGYTFDQGLALLEAAERAPHMVPDDLNQAGAYGCNMTMRASAIGRIRFDERLPLYGWQEDIDFTSQMRVKGRIISHSGMIGVHLGTKTGRINGVKFGYSQIANPLYLIRKGTMPAKFGARLMVRNFAANTARSLWPESYIDRRGRLYGNLVALWHAATGRVQPEYILQL